MSSDLLLAGRYQLGSELGRGASATVYRAYDPRLKRPVALKILDHKTSDDDDRRRFVREARALAQIRHPNVAEVYDVGSGVGFDYLAMELIDGPSLEEVLESAPLPLASRFLPWLIDIAAGLDAVHAAGLIHRDVKPANVRIASDRAVLVDFGLAFSDLQEAGDLARITQANMMVGTPCYLSPEQIRGSSVEAAADVYAFGCLIYQVLVGSPPFEGEIAEIFAKHLHLPPVPPADCCDRPVDPELNGLVMAMLAKDAKGRPEIARAKELLERLKAGDRNRPRHARRTLAPAPSGTAEGPQVETLLYCPTGLADDGTLALAMNEVQIVTDPGRAAVAYIGTGWKERRRPVEGLPTVVALDPSDVDELPELVRAGFADAVTTPIDWTELSRKLKRLARRRRR
ncbi:MAG: serine/threonine protein kinase [Deltaproteobacteria bacterium]|nr:serine/threonine protein kinase [Deltaproteobacteria bacterium]